MDDDFTPPSEDPEELRRIALLHEAGLRDLHKQLRWTGCHEASYALLEAADKALAAARALAPEMPRRHPTPDSGGVVLELFAAG